MNETELFLGLTDTDWLIVMLGWLATCVYGLIAITIEIWKERNL